MKILSWYRSAFMYKTRKAIFIVFISLFWTVSCFTAGYFIKAMQDKEVIRIAVEKVSFSRKMILEELIQDISRKLEE